MSEQMPANGQLLDAAVIAEAESAQWVAMQMQQTVSAIRPSTSEEILQQSFLARLKRHHTQRRWFGISLVSGTGLGGLALSADSMFDIEWVEIFGKVINWFARPLALKLVESLQSYLDWLA